jgi:hypothetical protein
MSLGDLVQQVLVRVGNAELHFQNERPWHELFFTLKQQREIQGRPAFLDRMFFEWNGPYPHSEELSRYLHGLHWAGCVTAGNPTYDTFRVNEDVCEIWRGVALEAPLDQFVDRAAEQVRNHIVAA